MIAILTDPSVGGTFLTWSLHYLAGHEKYYHVNSASWVDLPDNPLLLINAHGFKPNQPIYVSDLQKITSALELVDSSEFQTLYFHNLRDQFAHSDSFHQPTADTIDSILPKFKKVIVLTNSRPLYNVSFYGRALSQKITNSLITYKNFAEQNQEFIDYFFKESAEIWQKQKLSFHL